MTPLVLPGRSPGRPSPTVPGPQDLDSQGSWRLPRGPRSGRRQAGPTRRRSVSGGRAKLHAKWRTVGQSSLVTDHAAQRPHAFGRSAPPVGDCLFQVGFSLQALLGRHRRISRAPHLREDPEVQDLELLYDSVRAYAVGHGCAADWTEAESARRAKSTLRSFRATSCPRSSPATLTWTSSRPGGLPKAARSGSAVIDELRVFWPATTGGVQERQDEAARRCGPTSARG